LRGVPMEPEPPCRSYLAAHSAALGARALDAAYQYGTATWTVRDAIGFAHALASGVYGDAGRAALRLLGLPKLRSDEPGAVLTTDPGWGAGLAFGRSTAYKAGWGGARQGRFLVGQLAVVRAGGRTAAIAAMFHPAQQPTADDPGQVHAADALEALLSALAAQLARTPGAR
ncbi:MAG: hypothetical protein WBC33_07360, partial [Conexibacter sp.]